MKNIKLLIATCLLCAFSYGQHNRVSGLVVDGSGIPIPGAIVIVKGTTIGTLTDFNGEFTIAPLEDNEIIRVSYLGYVPQEINIKGLTELKMVMQEEISELNEVVLIGYGSQKKIEVTGAVSTVELKDVESRPLTSSSQILQGKVAGVSVTQSSGSPGDDNATIRIRGISSIDNNNDPLVIIDDIPGQLSDVNPADIESISVLKDAASASIYGSRASAGVIVIKTKRASVGKLSLDFNTITAVQYATKLPETLDSWVHAELTNEALRNVGQQDQYSREDIELFKYGIDPIRPNTDWYGIFLGDGLTQNSFLNVKQGTEDFTFTGSVGYYNQKGILKGTESDKVTYRTRFDSYFLNRKVKIGVALSGYDQVVDELISSTASLMNVLSATNATTFVESLPDEEGVTYYSGQGRYLGAKDFGGGIDRTTKSLITQYYMQIEPIKNLQAKLTYGNNKYNLEYQRFVPEMFFAGNILGESPSLTDSSLEKRFTSTTNSTLTTTLNYSKRLKKHNFSALLGYERLERIYQTDYAKVDDLSSNQPIFDLGDPNSYFLTSNANESSTVSYFGRLNYSFASKYLLELNMRRDGSSRFALENQWGNFPSISAGWVISKEKFMKSLDYLFLKLRGSWGRLGNQSIGSYYAASDQMSGSEFYNFGGSVVSGRGTIVLANPDTKWETTEQINLGFDLELFNRVSATFEYFDKKTYDILARVTIPTSLGVSERPYQNIGDMTNKGFELSLGYTSKPNKNGFSYSINTNFTYLKNEVTDLGGLDFVDQSDVLRSQVGHPFASFYGYKVDDIYQVDDFTWQNDSDPSIEHYNRDYQLKDENADPSGIMPRVWPGDEKFRDIDGNGIINSDDKTIIGRSVPKFYYGGTINLSYKNWGLNIIGQGIGGAEAYQNGYLQKFLNNGSNSSIQQFQADNRWTFDNPSTKYRRLTKSLERNGLESSYYVTNASYFRIKNIELSYNLPKEVIERLNISRLRLFFSAENILTFTNYISGFDPERPYNVTNQPFHPQIQSLSCGLNLNF
ncbi:hypothetical protein APS56_04805 [Pseudalgibacter alginicilyticus]|uniref:SusC/RagA family TonB-linked outer membrane protein n=1 Tax=Pseudalgibacter alginicilyticus TaxID=1736674 RepID=A0A0P0CVP1_9FLAO|nr:TonB-dependent receptor [Pseudalgibacter alginicilyticus]ALJ04499.1 hypothetical protein APS56_04805 [Pseudalgibacter alginicilyticus]